MAGSARLGFTAKLLVAVFLAGLLASGYAGSAHAASPVARWVADDWAGGTADWVDRVGGKVATVAGATNAPTKAAGGIAGSTSFGLVFDGVDDYFGVAVGQNPVQGATAATIAAFFKTSQGASAPPGGCCDFFWTRPGPINGEAPGSPNDWGLTYNGAGEAQAFFNNGITPAPAVSVIDGQPHTMILTWQTPEKVARLYVDGVLAGQVATGGAGGINNSNGLVFGSERENVARFFSGTIGELRFYTSVEDPAAVHTELVTAPATPATPAAPVPPPPPPPHLVSGGPRGTTVAVAGSGSVAVNGGSSWASWEAGAFAPGVDVTVTQTTSAGTGGGFAVGGHVLAVSATGPLSGTLRLRFPPWSVGMPAYSADGVSWRAIPRLSSPSLPDGQQDGYFVNADGTIDVFTRHLSFFGVLRDAQAPSVPAELEATYAKGKLSFAWKAASDNVGVAGYRLRRDSTQVASIMATVASVRAWPGRYSLTALDAAGNESAAVTLTVSMKPLPAGVPKRVPQWAYRLLAGRQAAKAPTPLPKWYAAWRAWRLQPYRLLTP